MAADRMSSPDDQHDHGVLDEVGIDTTAIDLGSTAQVPVMLPAGYRDDDADDEVTADELSAEEIARRDAEAEREDDDTALAERIDAGDDAADAPGDDESDVDAPEHDAPDAESIGESDADALVDDESTADVLSDDEPDAEETVGESGVADEARWRDRDEARAIEDAALDVDDESLDVDGADLDDATSDEDEPESVPEDVETHDAADPVSEAEGEAVSEEDADDAALDGEPVAEDGSDLDEVDAAGADGAPDAAELSAQDAVDAVEDSAGRRSDDIPTDDAPAGERTGESVNDDAARDETPNDDGTEIPSVAVREPSPVPAAVSEGTANRVQEAARVGRPSFLKPAARATTPATAAVRADRIAVDADRESSDVLTDERLLDTGAIRRPEPEDPWRRIVYSATRGVINLGDGKRTRARRELMSRIAAPLPGRARFVPVLSRKGGVGKTTVTALLGMALADARNDRVVAVDANPDRGTLAERIAKPSGKTVRDLVRSRDEVQGYGDISAHVVRDATRLDVLASDADPHIADAFSDGDYREVAEIAQHYYSIVLTDTGTGIVHSVMEATLDLADQLVIVSGTSVDEARLASETLTWLETNGHAETARNAVVVINQDSPAKAHVRLDELETHFRSRVGAVVRLPYDARLATGSAIPFHELGRATRDAARRLAALVVEGIRAA